MANTSKGNANDDVADGSSQSSKAADREDVLLIHENGGKDGNALGETSFRLNPEVVQRGVPLPGLDQIEVVMLQPAQGWARWTEGLVIHVAGSLLFLGLAFLAGAIFGGSVGVH